MTTNIESLERLTLAIEAKGVDIAPEYNDYFLVANAIATDCGEAGRAFFHRICQLSAKYKRPDAEKIFDNLLRTNRGEVHLATLFELAKRAGVTLCANHDAAPEKRGAGAVHTAPPHTHTREAEAEDEDTDPKKPLPFLPEHDWPHPLAEIVAMGKTRAQRDILFLAACTVLGATLERHVRILYGGKMWHPCMQTFIVAPPASGKGMLALFRLLVEPIHYEIREKVEKQMTAYLKDKAAYDAAGRERANMEIPKKPLNQMFLIPGNNTGTGILQNIIESFGVGLILEVEADTISTAIGTENGHWSDTMRKGFDHDPLAYNRRTNEEYREVKKTYLSILLSGTPGQVRPLIPSSENGLFSRQIFYYMAGIREWQNQFDSSGTDLEEEFRKMGWEWKRRVEEIRGKNLLTLKLTPDQIDRFNARFAEIFERSGKLNGDEMKSSVARLAINLCRIFCVVAVLRGEMKPDGGIPFENLADGIVQRWDLSVNDADFGAVLGMADTLYTHATHILSYLPNKEVERRQNVVRDDFFTALPQTFSHKDLAALAEEMGVNLNTAESWLKRLRKKKLITYGAEGYTRVCV